MSLPVIATNWSGPTAYLDETVGYPLPIEGLADSRDAEGAFKGACVGALLGGSVAWPARGLLHCVL